MRGTLLVIDPSPTVQKVVQLVLGRQGFRVAAAADAASAEAVVEGPIDLLIAAASGWSDALASLRRSHGRGGVCPVLMLVESGQSRTGQSFPHLLKPFTPDRLVAAVETLLAPGDDVVASPSPPPAPGQHHGIQGDWLSGAGRPVLWCHIGAFPLPDLLQFLRAQRWEYQLRIRSAARQVNITMRRGRVDFVTAQGLGQGFRLGRFLAEVGAIRTADLESFVASGSGDGMPLGKALCAAGLVTAEQLLSAVRAQTCSLFYEVLRWQEGEAAVIAEAAHDELAQEMGLALTVEQLLMEGFRHEAEWENLQKQLPRPNERLVPNLLVINGFDLSRLSPLESEALQRLRDGGSTGQLIERMNARPIEVCRAVRVLMGARLLRSAEEGSE